MFTPFSFSKWFPLLYRNSIEYWLIEPEKYTCMCTLRLRCPLATPTTTPTPDMHPPVPTPNTKQQTNPKNKNHKTENWKQTDKYFAVTNFRCYCCCLYVRPTTKHCLSVYMLYVGAYAMPMRIMHPCICHCNRNRYQNQCNVTREQPRDALT